MGASLLRIWLGDPVAEAGADVVAAARHFDTNAVPLAVARVIGGRVGQQVLVPQVLLDTVATGPLWTEAKWMRDLLVDPKTTSAVLVSLPEEMPVNETLELEEALRKKVKIPTALVVLNGYTAPRFDERDLAALGGSALLPLGKNHFDRAQLSLDSRNRLERAVAAPVATVPRLYEQTQGMGLVEKVADALSRALESAP
jgi:anion-transporting  ArsA/GET3 family ATPase